MLNIQQSIHNIPKTLLPLRVEYLLTRENWFWIFHFAMAETKDSVVN